MIKNWSWGKACELYQLLPTSGGSVTPDYPSIGPDYPSTHSASMKTCGTRWFMYTADITVVSTRTYIVHSYLPLIHAAEFLSLWASEYSDRQPATAFNPAKQSVPIHHCRSYKKQALIAQSCTVEYYYSTNTFSVVCYRLNNILNCVGGRDL